MLYLTWVGYKCLKIMLDELLTVSKCDTGEIIMWMIDCNSTIAYSKTRKWAVHLQKTGSRSLRVLHAGARKGRYKKQVLSHVAKPEYVFQSRKVQ